MEDAPDSVVPLRPGFDIQIRGFNKNQVIEHIELLEDQLRIVTIDRNEAVSLNNDLRRLCDDTRHNLTKVEGRLKRIESSDTGLPAASQRVQNMLTIAEEEVQTLRDQARRQAETIRGSAETEAKELIAEAENTADELRTECARLVADVETRRDQLRREHAEQVKDLRERERRMRQAIRDEYKRTMAEAEDESDELLTRTRRQCGEWDAETEQHRLDVLEELSNERSEVEKLRNNALSSLEEVQDVLRRSSAALHTPLELGAEPIEDGDATSAAFPGPREDTQPIAVTPEQHSYGDSPAADVPGFADARDTAGRN